MPHFTTIHARILAAYPCPWHETIIATVQDELVRAFPDPVSAQNVAGRAGLDIYSIVWQTSARNFWHEIVDHAYINLEGGLSTLLAAAEAAFAETERHGTCRCSDLPDCGPGQIGRFLAKPKRKPLTPLKFRADGTFNTHGDESLTLHRELLDSFETAAEFRALAKAVNLHTVLNLEGPTNTIALLLVHKANDCGRLPALFAAAQAMLDSDA